MIPRLESSVEQPPTSVLTTVARVALLQGAAGQILPNHWSMVLTAEPDPPVIRPTKEEGLRQAEAPESFAMTRSAEEQFAEMPLSRCYIRHKNPEKQEVCVRKLCSSEASRCNEDESARQHCKPNNGRKIE